MSTDTQHFSLRWNNYLRHITRAFDSLRSEDNFVDVTLSCEGKKIRAHKMLLSACSTYFRDLFRENPCQHPIIILKNVKFEDLEALVEFIYQGEVNVVQEQLTSFLTTAELLAVQGLTNDPSKEVEEPPEEVSLEPPRPAKPKRNLPENRTPSPSTSRSNRKRRRTHNSEESLIKKPVVEEDDDDDVTFVPEMMPGLKVEMPEYIDNNADINQPAEEPNEMDDTADNSCDAYDEQGDVKNDAMELQNIVYEAQGDDLTGTEMSHMLDNPGTSDNLQDPTLQADYNRPIKRKRMTILQRWKIIEEVERNPNEKKYEIAKRLGISGSRLSSILASKNTTKEQVKILGTDLSAVRFSFH